MFKPRYAKLANSKCGSLVQKCGSLVNKRTITFLLLSRQDSIGVVCI